MQITSQSSFQLAGANLLLIVRNVNLLMLSQGKLTPLAQGDLSIYALAVTSQSSQVVEMTVLTLPLLPRAARTGDLSKEQLEDTFQLPLTEDMSVVKQDESALLFPAPGESIFYKLNLANGDKEEISTLEDLLSHYTAYRMPSKVYRNTLALVDNKGQVLGKLSDDVRFDTDQVNQNENGPVIISVENNQDSTQPTVITVKSSTGEQMVQKSEKLGELLVQGALYVGSGIATVGQSIKPKLTPKVTETAFTPETKMRLDQAKQVTSVALKATKMAVTGATFLAGQVGSIVASKIRGSEHTKGPKSSSVIKFTGQLIQAMGILSESVSQSARIVLRSTAVQTVDLIKHVYGTEAAIVANDVTSLGEQLWVVYFDARGFRRMAFMTGIKGTIKSTLKELHETGNTSEQSSNSSKLNAFDLLSNGQALLDGIEETKKKQ